MVNVFSFCLFGEPSSINGRVEQTDSTDDEIPLGGYYQGLIENIELVRKHYPGWVVYVYMGEDVPETFAMRLLRTYSNVQIRRTGIVGYKNTAHRFFAIDEPGVDVMFVRDTDSRIHWKDRWAIQSFLKQNIFHFHIIRDHSQHTSKIGAGMWGMRKGALKERMRDLFANWTPVWAGHGNMYNLEGYGIDQNFLASAVYPKVKSNTLVTYSNGRLFDGEVGVEFPFEWTNDMYVGRVESRPVTESFWLREKDSWPPQTKPTIMPAALIFHGLSFKK